MCECFKSPFHHHGLIRDWPSYPAQARKGKNVANAIFQVTRLRGEGLL